MNHSELSHMAGAVDDSTINIVLVIIIICPLAESYVTGSAREAGAAAELAASRKEEKYASIGSEYLFAHGTPTICQSGKKEDLLGVRR